MKAGKNTPQSVLRYIDVVWARNEIDPIKLATELGYNLKAIGRLREKHGDDLLPYLLSVQRSRIERPRFMAKQQGRRPNQLRQYTTSAEGAIDDAETVGDLAQRRFSEAAFQSDADRLQEDILAMEDVRSALDDLLKERPHLKQTIGKELWQIRGRIQAAKTKLKHLQTRRAAA